ncbi:hypothetical protein [Epilithonimonas lactis]|nr:hypothetical protein [Epilithonimonas lactis]
MFPKIIFFGKWQWDGRWMFGRLEIGDEEIGDEEIGDEEIGWW